MEDYIYIDEFKINITPEQLELLNAKYKEITDLPLSDVVRNRLIVFAMDWNFLLRLLVLMLHKFYGDDINHYYSLWNILNTGKAATFNKIYLTKKIIKS